MSDPETARKRSGAPRFYPRKTYLARDYYVLVVWPEGSRQRVDCFSNRQDAAIWVKRSASEWLAALRKVPKTSSPASRTASL